MKKPILRMVISIVLLLAILFTPIPKGVYKDGGTREYAALTYKLVDWNRLTADDVYDETKIYWFPNNFLSIDDLWAMEEPNVVNVFVATVLELKGDFVLVEPVDGEWERMSSDKITFSMPGLEALGVQVGSDVEVHYTGGIMESYPAQVNAVKCDLAKTLRHKEYGGQWLDKKTAEKTPGKTGDHIIITEIYSDCFFAVPTIPMPHQIKVNGQLSEEWCVGDQVYCTYENVYYDGEHHRMEADMGMVEPSDWEPEPGVAYKPVIYLYPEEEMEISAKLRLDGKLTCTYPAYRDGWNVTAAPDGTLTDAKGQTYNYLYWEGETEALWDMTEGFCVKGEDTAAFLEDALEKLGLTRREANEFIVYWLPLMEQNPYNVISFQTDIYTDAAQLNIEPAPDTMIRVFMAWYASESYVNLDAQELTAPQRTGFTVVEWGGTEIKY